MDAFRLVSHKPLIGFLRCSKLPESRRTAGTGPARNWWNPSVAIRSIIRGRSLQRYVVGGKLQRDIFPTYRTPGTRSWSSAAVGLPFEWQGTAKDHDRIFCQWCTSQRSRNIWGERCTEDGTKSETC